MSATAGTFYARYMTPKAMLLTALLLLLGACSFGVYTARYELSAVARRVMAGQGKRYIELPPPIHRMYHIFDLGLVDADGDGRLDLYSSNHNYRQVLLLNRKQGHVDILSDWGLDQNPDFPAWEQSFVAPRLDKPGLYVYWLGESLVLRTHGLPAGQTLSGRLRMFSRIGVVENVGFSVNQRSLTVTDSPISQTLIDFKAQGDGKLVLNPLSRGVPTQIEIAPTLPYSQIFVGLQKVSPMSHTFSPYLRDRHALAWVDFDADGRLDVYISRGGVGGTLRKLPPMLRAQIGDELLLTGGRQRFSDVAVERGIRKKDCSGRHAEWVDFDGDGRLDLFVNCQDRGKSQGPFPKQLWRQVADGRFEDVAVEIGLGMTETDLIDFVWFDVDGDGAIDLLTSEDKGFFIYRNVGARFTPELVYRPRFVRADVAALKGEVNNYWRFDGKLAAADFDADGDMDIFSSSKRGNVLLLNEAGRLRAIAPDTIGLPPTCLNAVWVDADDDGRPDLHCVPDGIYRQVSLGRFRATGLLAMPRNKYQAAIVHWYDRDNDGRRDVLVAVNENPNLWRWWQKPFKQSSDAFAWDFYAYRNLGVGNHWLQIEVGGPAGNRQAIGAQVTIATPGGVQTQVVGGSDTSFFSQGHYRLYFGLGTHGRVSNLSIRWPDGQRLDLREVAADRRLSVAYPGPPPQRPTQ